MNAFLPPLRTSVVLPAAGLITIGLFVAMRQLIDIGEVHREPVAERPPVQIRFDIPDADPVRPGLEQIEAVTPPPPVEGLVVPRAEPAVLTGGPVYTLPPTDRPILDQTVSFNPVSRSPMPIVRIDPVYPANALRRGLEGQCTMIFDITPQGTTTNVRALSCTSTQFERASVNAVSRWRYNPQVRDGAPQIFRGATTQLRFAIDS